MTYSIALIDKAGEKCGSFYALSKRIDLAQSTISEIRAGKRRLPADVVPLIAEVLGMDVDEAIHGVLMEHAKGTKREAVLREILGKGIAAGVAAMLVFSYSDGLISRMEKATKTVTTVNFPTIVSTLGLRLSRLFTGMIRRWSVARLSGARPEAFAGANLDSFLFA
jgi:transcriptional regulator with XRE-family HTH domain